MVYDEAWDGLAAVQGLLRCFALEHQDCQVKEIAYSALSSAQLVDAVGREMLRGGYADRVVLRGSQRFTEAWLPLAAPKALVPPHKLQGFWVVSGGARGVTAACLKALCRLAPQRLLLIGRQRLQEEASASALLCGKELKTFLFDAAKRQGQSINPRELQTRYDSIINSRVIRQNLSKLEKLGAKVIYASLDCRSGADLSRAVSAARASFGPVTGLIHGAGVIDDGLFGQLSSKQFERVYSTKVEGLRQLLRVCSEDPLDYLVGFSSIAACFGNRGQGVYALANACITRILLRYKKEHPQCNVKAIHWGAWDGGMVDATLKQKFSKSGVQLLPIELGMEEFLRVFSHQSELEVIVAAGDPLAFARRPANFSLQGLMLKQFDGLSPGDHAIKGAKILPLATIVALSLQVIASYTRWPLEEIVLESSKVLKKALATQILSLKATSHASHATWKLLWQDKETKTFHYELRVTRARRSKQTLENTLFRVAAKGAVKVQYDGKLLFHGPSFHFLKSYSLLSDKLAVLDFATACEAKSPLAVCDAALQAALLTASKLRGMGTLPLAIENLRIFTNKVPTEGWITVSIESSAKSLLACRIEVFADDKKLYACFDSVRLVQYFSKQQGDRPIAMMH